MTELHGRLLAIGSRNFITPVLNHEGTEHGVSDEEVSFSIKRLHTLFVKAEAECAALPTSAKEVERVQKRGFAHLVFQHLQLEVWRQYPELMGKKVVFYSDWRVGPEKPDAQTKDLFHSAPDSKDVRSTRSDGVRMGPILGASLTN